MSTLRTVNHQDVEPKNKLDKFFKISQRGSTLGADVVGNFLAMSYIIVLNQDPVRADGSGHRNLLLPQPRL